MPTKEARWVHGNAIVAEMAETLHPGLVQVTSHPGLVQVTSEGGSLLTNTEIVGDRRGWGVTYQGSIPSFNWFHAAIPTPTVVNYMRTRLDRVYVLYLSNNQVQIRHIHVWDGPNPIWGFNDLTGLHGDHSRHPFVDGQNSFKIPETPEVSFGIGISIGVEFLAEGAPQHGAPTILFTSAGADFLY